MGALVSYASVSTRGFQSYVDVLTVAPNPTDWIYSFVESPIESMRASINMRVWYVLQRLGDRWDTRFVGIERGDRESIGELIDVRTHYLVGKRPTEILWTRECGHWRVKNVKVTGSAELQEAAIRDATPD